jgi:hypothetical protein
METRKMGLMKVDKTFLMQVRMEQEKRDKELEEQEKKEKLETKPRPLWRNDWNK